MTSEKRPHSKITIHTKRRRSHNDSLSSKFMILAGTKNLDVAYTPLSCRRGTVPGVEPNAADLTYLQQNRPSYCKPTPRIQSNIVNCNVDPMSQETRAEETGVIRHARVVRDLLLL